jgi:hypothetical protein
MRMLSRASSALLVGLFFLAPALADATTLYCVSNSSTCTPSSSSSVSGAYTSALGTASANAGNATLGAKAAAVGVGASNGSQVATAAFSGYQITFSGPGGSTTTSLKLTLTGSMSGPVPPFSQETLTVSAVLTGSLGSATGNGSLLASAQPNPGFPMFGPPYNILTGSSGMLAGLPPIGGTFSTPTLSIVSGETISLSLSLTADAFCQSTGSGCSQIIDFSNTLKFAQSGPVFTLPAGWTANSADGRIVNNAFVNVPEPSSGALVAASLAGIVARRRRAAR